MDFKETETYYNLAKSFAGESQAGLRYQFTARTAFQQGYKILSDVIRSIAKNETNHAKVFFDKIIEHAGIQDNIEICGGYPFVGGTIEQNLKAAMDGETNESLTIYPSFRDIALKEGFLDIARIYDMVGDIESQHKIIFEYLYESFKNDTLYKNDAPILWRCSNCGYQVTTKEAFHICPLCQASQGFVELHLPYKKEN
jgi:rubrerythrin